jgi:hypothetical protein
MKNKTPIFRSIVAIACLILSCGWLAADTVKLKDGTSVDGKITYEGTDFIKLEVAISASIKETKTILRTDIGEIVKAAPDDVALDAIRKQLPAPAMLTADAYRAMIEKGPKAFLAQFPASRHKAEVEKALSDLTMELDQVERGFIKLDGTWVSPQERQQFSALTDSKIRLLSMKRRLAAGDMIGALRDFEILEEQFYGTPAFAAALTDAKQMLPALGSRLQRVLADVGVRNEKWEKDKLLLDEVSRAQVEGARARELDNYTKAVALEKGAGVKWLSINENSAESLNGALQTIRGEMERLAVLDVAALTALGDKLVAADKLIAEGKLVEAKAAVSSATAGVAAPAKSSSSKSSKSSRSGATSKTSYIASLNEKISAAEKALAAAKKQAADTAIADKAASVIKSAESAVAKALKPDSPAPTDGSAPAAPAEGTEPAKGEAPKAGNSNAELEDLLAATATKAAPAKTAETKKTASSSKRPTKKSQSDDDEDGDDMTDKAKPVVADTDDGGGGSFKFQYVIWGVTALLIIVVAAMKFGGLGGKKA